MYRESYFDGGLFSYIGHVLLATFITVFTFGICAPLGHVHTDITGRLSIP